MPASACALTALGVPCARTIQHRRTAGCACLLSPRAAFCRSSVLQHTCRPFPPTAECCPGVCAPTFSVFSLGHGWTAGLGAVLLMSAGVQGWFGPYFSSSGAALGRDGWVTWEPCARPWEEPPRWCPPAPRCVVRWARLGVGEEPRGSEPSPSSSRRQWDGVCQCVGASGLWTALSAASSTLRCRKSLPLAKLPCWQWGVGGGGEE